jgi:hypothetical protein
MKVLLVPALLAAAGAAFAQTQAPPLTVTGCLTAAQDKFTLTVTDAQQPGTTTTPTTVTYSLQPAASVDLKAHVNHKVEVKGTEGPGQTQAAVVDSSRSQATPAGTSGTAGSTPTPTVETTAKAQIVAKPLSVESIRMVADRCDETR